MMTNLSKVIVALDYANLNDALTMADKLDPTLCRVKVGKELFTAVGPEVVWALSQRGFEVFLDLKFHDIPNTVKGAVQAAVDLGVWMVNVHAMGGPAMLDAAAHAVNQSGTKTLLTAVTILTSVDLFQYEKLGFKRDLNEQVISLAGLAYQHGLHGVVCSAKEAGEIKSITAPSFKCVTPGIRFSDDSADDQARICTPKEAFNSGVDFLVMGRPIRNAQDPNEKLRQIAQIAA